MFQPRVLSLQGLYLLKTSVWGKLLFEECDKAIHRFEHALSNCLHISYRMADKSGSWQSVSDLHTQPQAA